MAFDFHAEVTAGLAEIQAAAGVTVRYLRGVAYMDILATRGKTPFEAADVQGRVITGEIRDYIFAVENFLFTDTTDDSILSIIGPVYPKVGDIIIDGEGDRQVTCQVAPLQGIGHWKYSDQARTFIRVHTRVVDREE